MLEAAGVSQSETGESPIRARDGAVEPSLRPGAWVHSGGGSWQSGFLCGLRDGPAVATWTYDRLRLRTTSKEPSMLKNITGKTATAFSMRRYRSG